MRASQSFKKAMLVSRRAHSAQLARPLNALRELDPDAEVLLAPESWVSRDLTGLLWAALPDESFAYSFSSPDTATTEGEIMLPVDLNERVVIHLGRGDFCLRATLSAAWFTWPRYCSESVDAYNSCIYPESVAWYIVRAGGNVYPMSNEDGDEPQLRTFDFPTGRASG